MSNSKLIIVEGAQGAGKTTITDYIRHSLKYTNLYRLCGISDSTLEGKKNTTDMYIDLLEYMEKMQNKNINLLFDRTFFESPVDIPFEDTVLMGSEKIKEYLEYRYGDYMKLPSEEARKAAVHAFIYDTEKDYKEYLENR